MPTIKLVLLGIIATPPLNSFLTRPSGQPQRTLKTALSRKRFSPNQRNAFEPRGFLGQSTVSIYPGDLST